jgi:hypothetical protein
MKLRHAAALALTGWCLMFPPTRKNAQSYDLAAPVDEWRVLESFGTDKECEDRRISLENGQLAQQQNEQDPGIFLPMVRGLKLRCIQCK